MAIGQWRTWIAAKDNSSSLTDAARAAAAAVVSFLVARLFRLPEAYWAPIITLVVMQSTLAASLPISAQRFVGTAVGAAAGALVGTYFPGSVIAFGIAVLVIGILCAALRIERPAYRYAAITLAIVMLIPRSTREWEIAIHRFCEVSIGIAVGLAMSAIWPESNGDPHGRGSKGKVLSRPRR
jgi:uncharacterized membrane protein YgaE (UPF0421/DUF939 family)